MALGLSMKDGRYTAGVTSQAGVVEPEGSRGGGVRGETGAVDKVGAEDKGPTSSPLKMLMIRPSLDRRNQNSLNEGAVRQTESLLDLLDAHLEYLVELRDQRAQPPS